MKDTLTPFNRDDFRQRYKSNYGFLTTEQGRRLVFIQDVTPDRVSFVTDDRGDMYYANAGAGIMFDFLPIVRGWYPTQDVPVFLTRIPAKQYHRGISANNTAVMQATGDWLRGAELNLTLLSQLFETPAEYSYKDFTSGVVNYCVLSKAFCISDNTVYFFTQIVGSYIEGTITLQSSLIQQEINDVIRRRGINITVKVLNANS